MISGDHQASSCKLHEKTRETSDDHWQNVMYLTFEYDSDKITYEPGDVACIYPQNDEKEVLKLLEYFELKPDTVLNIKLKETFSYLRPIKAMPEEITAYNLFSYILDIKKPPKFFFFKLIAFYTLPEDMQNEYSCKEK